MLECSKQASEYEVIWNIDLTARSPEEAAQIAQEIQRDPSSTANVFRVVQKRNDELEKSFSVDLDENS